MFRLFLSLSCLCLFLCGCTKHSKVRESRKIIRLSSPCDPSTFDPRTGRDLTTLNICHQMFSSLVRVDHQGTLVYDLCSSILAEDDCLYRIKLREAFWSDGRPITAYDVRSSWISLLNPKRLSPHASDLFIIEGAKEFYEDRIKEDGVQIVPINEKELLVRLQEPCPFFESLLATPWTALIQPNLDANASTRTLPASMPVSGPYCVALYLPRNKLILQKNERYVHASEIDFDTVEIYFVDDSTSLSMLERGEIDWVGSPLGSLLTDYLGYLKQRDWLHFSTAAGTAFVRVNTTNPSLADPSLRRALSCAIQRQNIVKNILVEGYTEAHSLLPPCFFSPKNATEEKAIEERAQERLKNFEHRWRTEPSASTLRLAYSNVSERNRRIAQTISQNMEEALGLSVVLTPYDAQTFYQRVATLDYDLALGSFFADYMNPYSFFSLLKTKNNGMNNTGWEHIQYITLMHALLDSQNVAQQSIYNDLLSLLQEEMPVIPLYHYCFLYGTRWNTHSVAVTPLGYFDFHTR